MGITTPGASPLVEQAQANVAAMLAQANATTPRNDVALVRKASKAPKGKGKAKDAAQGKAKPPKGKPAATETARGNGGKYGITRSRDLPWCASKAAVFAALLAEGALSPQTAKAAKELAPVAAKRGLPATDAARLVRHYSYHGAAANLVAVVPGAFGGAHGFYLTTKGKAELAQHAPAKTAKPRKAKETAPAATSNEPAQA